MTVVPLDRLGADVAPAHPVADPGGFARTLRDSFAAAGEALERADGSERAFAAGRGGLQEMIVDRARADVTLALATAAASRVTQALSTLLGMQI